MSFRVLFLVLLLSSGFSSWSQDLFNYENSKAFADYLFKTKRFDFATKEYDRVLFLVPADTSSWLNLIRSYHHLRDYPSSLKYLERSEEAIGGKLSDLGLLKAYTFLKTGAYGKLEEVQNQYALEEKDWSFINASANALSGNWNYFEDSNDADYYWLTTYKEMAVVLHKQRNKSPLLAGTLSALVPGTGKMYAKRWKDGLFSMLLVGATSWQASRLISKNGIDNFGSIFFSGFAVGLYAGNVYGSVKSAKDYNQKLKTEYDEKTNQLVDLYFNY